MEALGKGLLIATAGLVAGLMFGTAHLPDLSMWTVGVAAATGVGCMIGSALVKNAAFNDDRQEGEGSPPAAEAGKSMAATQAVEAARDDVPEERWACRIAMKGRQREHDSGRGA